MASAPFALRLLRPGELLNWRESRPLPEDHIYLGILRGVNNLTGLLYVQPLEPDARWRDELVNSLPSSHPECETVLVRAHELLLLRATTLFLLHVSV